MTTSAYGDVRIQERRGAGVAYRIGLENRSPAAVPGPRVRIPVPPYITFCRSTTGKTPKHHTPTRTRLGSRATPPLVRVRTPVASSAASIHS